MKHFTLINFLTKQYTTIEADNRRIATQKAVELAIELNLDHTDNDVAYWVVMQEYHNLNGFTELKAPEEIKEEMKQEDKPMNTKAYEQLTLEQVRESFKTLKGNIEFLQQEAGDATSAESARMAHIKLNSAKEALEQLKASVTKYLMTGEW